MDTSKFLKVSESLRQYRRAELTEYEPDIGENPIEALYVDPLPDDAVLKSIISNNTSFLVGRKGTGKSTIFARAQQVYRSDAKFLSVYIDVKSLNDLVSSSSVPFIETDETKTISKDAYNSHMLRKATLGHILAELIKEITIAADKMSLKDRWTGKKRTYLDLKSQFVELIEEVKTAKLEINEIPILQKISRSSKKKEVQEKSSASSKGLTLKGKISPDGFDADLGGISSENFDKTLEDKELYNEYSDIVYRSFPFDAILEQIQSLLNDAGLSKLVVFFDDFSELNYVDQRLFVDVILSPLNNASKEKIKLKIAGYPGRVYYGKIDPGKADLFSLDFADLYESTDIQEMESAAQNYTKRLLEKRFKAFESEIESFFDLSSATMDEYITLIFQTSFNVPRIMGYLLHQCYIDRISKGQKINIAALKLASKKYYESKIIPYFDRLNRYALEPFEQKLDRYSQRQLLEAVISEMKDIRKNILYGGLGGSYFSELKLNIPTSHFAVSKELEGIFHSLESNFFISKYRSMRDKEGKDVSIYGLFYGLTESERMLWGHPVGRKYRGYFVQRCFDFTKAIHEYLTSSSTIRCSSCLHCFPLEQKASIELYRWRCPNCNEGICSEVKLADDFINEVKKLDHEIMLPKVELEILATLEEEGRKMRANEIALLIDTTYQLVGRRTSKLRDEGLVSKTREDGATKNDITDKAQHLYFDDE